LESRRIASQDPKPGSISSLRCHKSRTLHPEGSRVRSDVLADDVADAMLPTRCCRHDVADTILPFGVSPFSLYKASLGTPSLPASRSCATQSPKVGAWWSQTGSNRRPHACKARALPAELWPRTRRRNASRRSARPASKENALDQMVGLGRLELPTSRLSSARSNQLSYKPLTLILNNEFQSCQDRGPACASAERRMHRTAQAPGAYSSAKKEKRRRRNPANGAQQSCNCWPLMFLKRSDR
jgi:hypothetical protein